MIHEENSILKFTNLLRQMALSTAFVLASLEVAAAQSVDITYDSTPQEELRIAIKDRLPEFRPAQSSLHARRQARQVKALITNTLNAYGYYAPSITINVTEGNGRPTPAVAVDTGPLFKLGRVELKFSEPAPRAEDIKAVEDILPVKSGMPAVPAQIIDAQRVIAAELHKLGYAFAEVTDRDVIGDKDAATISVRYNIISDHRVRFGELKTPDDVRTKRKYLARLNTTEQNEIYDPSQLALYNSRLAETRLYRSSIAKLSAKPISVTDEGDRVHDVVLELTERPRNTIALGGNYGTDEGFGVNAELTRRNITCVGDVLVAETNIAERAIGLNVTWRRPNELGYGKGLTYTAGILDENTDAFDQQTARLGVGLEIIQGPKLNYNFGVNGQYIRQTAADERQTFQTISGYAGVRLDHSDSLLDPRRGWRLEGRVAPTYAFGGDGGDAPFLRGVVQGRAYLPLDSQAKYVMAGRLRLGTLFGAGVDDVPSESRFYAGGGGSVRGYGYQAIGPFDEDDVPEGGRSLLDMSIEGRWRYNDKIGIVGFVDAGNVSDAEYPQFENSRIGAGIGARYMTPAGPIRIDLATPLNPSDRDEPIQVYISIGQAF